MTGNHSTRRIQSCVLLAALFLSACGEFAYKRGASANDLEATKKSCVAKNVDKLEVEKCMTDNGWLVKNLDSAESIDFSHSESGPFIEVSITEDNQQRTNPIQSSKVSSGDEVKSSAELKNPAKETDTFKIGSWWKLGASADNLQNSIKTCVTAIGEMHQPVTHTNKVTRGLLLCMKEKGWHGLREK